MTIASRVTDTALSVGVYAVDTVSIGKHWDFTGGIRFDRFDDTYDQTVAPASHFNRVDQKPRSAGHPRLAHLFILLDPEHDLR